MQFLIKGTALYSKNIKGVFIAIQWKLSRSAGQAEIMCLNVYFRKELKRLNKNYIEVEILEEIPQLTP